MLHYLKLQSYLRATARLSPNSSCTSYGTCTFPHHGRWQATGKDLCVWQQDIGSRHPLCLCCLPWAETHHSRASIHGFLWALCTAAKSQILYQTVPASLPWVHGGGNLVLEPWLSAGLGWHGRERFLPSPSSRASARLPPPSFEKVHHDSSEPRSPVKGVVFSLHWLKRAIKRWPCRWGPWTHHHCYWPTRLSYRMRCQPHLPQLCGMKCAWSRTSACIYTGAPLKPWEEPWPWWLPKRELGGWTSPVSLRGRKRSSSVSLWTRRLLPCRDDARKRKGRVKCFNFVSPGRCRYLLPPQHLCRRLPSCVPARLPHPQMPAPSPGSQPRASHLNLRVHGRRSPLLPMWRRETKRAPPQLMGVLRSDTPPSAQSSKWAGRPSQTTALPPTIDVLLSLTIDVLSSSEKASSGSLKRHAEAVLALSFYSQRKRRKVGPAGNSMEPQPYHKSPHQCTNTHQCPTGFPWNVQ